MMLRRLLFILIAGLFAAASPAFALTLAVKASLGPPGWVLPYQPNVQFDFARGAAWKGTGTGGGAVVPVSSVVLASTASIQMVSDLAGRWSEVPVNTLARSNAGASFWEARTNLALWSRNWTNAVWVKVTMNTALTATGINGTANAATTITATGASSTILQTVVQASTADTVSIFVRRRTGTGTIEVTADGVAFTDITAALATAALATPGGWYRATVSATLVNPVFGVRITTSGDAVDVDGAQLEAGTFATPPIFTTTVSATRASSNNAILEANGLVPFSAATLSVLMHGTPRAIITYTVTQTGAQIDDGVSGANLLTISRLASTGLARMVSRSNSINTALNGAAWTSDVAGKIFAASQASDQVLVFNGGTPITSAAGAALQGSIVRLLLGGAGGWNGDQTTFAVWPRRLSNAIGGELTR